MAIHPLVVIAGLIVVAIGIVIYLVLPAKSNKTNSIKAGPLEFSLNTPAFVFMAFGIVLVFVSSFLPADERTQPASSDADVDPSLIGAWEGDHAFEGNNMHLQFRFQKTSFSRRYSVEENGVYQKSQDMVMFPQSAYFKIARLTGGNAFVSTFALTGAAMRFSKNSEESEASNPTANDAVIGIWTSDAFILGADFRFKLELAGSRNYSLKIDSSDEGNFRAAHGEWRMVSNWSTSPITGTYHVLSPSSLAFDIWPFDRVQLTRSE